MDFSVLDPTTPIQGTYTLEASAGTGKTFAIEHLFVRLLLEGDWPLLIEQIVAITFTRASTRDMRMRIRANLLQAHRSLQQKQAPWPYLENHLHSKVALRRLAAALTSFDRAQIFTIHGFCERMLAEYAVEAEFLPSKKNEEPPRKRLLTALLSFLEHQTILAPEQMGILLSKWGSLSELCDAILKTAPVSKQSNFQRDLALFQTTLAQLNLSPTLLRKEFELAQDSCKTTGFQGDNWEEQLASLEQLILTPQNASEAMRRLLFWKGSLFSFVAPSNRKLRSKVAVATPLLDACVTHLLPIIEEATHPLVLLRRLRLGWQVPWIETLEEYDLFSPDYILQKMGAAVEKAAFCEAIRTKFRAAIIDEFQDTDALQWHIFKTLFLGTLPTLYLVGDPKQSIYRFRQADLYTYFQAKQETQKNFFLGTNFRSTPGLVRALNTLFGDETTPWLWLPKENRLEPYHSVKAGQTQSELADSKQPLHFFCVEHPLGDASLSYLALEIQRLFPTFQQYRSFAVLVRDRAQARQVKTFLEERNIPSFTRSNELLGHSLAARQWKSIFAAIFNEESPLLALSLPFSIDPLDLAYWKSLLEQNEMALFLRQVKAKYPWSEEMELVAERLLKIALPSPETIKQAFQEWRMRTLEEESQIPSDNDAVQIMTIHGSKGLEFDIVFALGVASRTPRASEELEEVEAEKLRQLYVALTRAKYRLYIPISPERSSPSTESCLALFWQRNKQCEDPTLLVQRLAREHKEISCELVDSALWVPPSFVEASSAQPPITALFPPALPGKTVSYSTLASLATESSPSPNTAPNQPTIPRGAATGNLIHRILERALTETKNLHLLCEEELQFTVCYAWRKEIAELIADALSTPLVDGKSLREVTIVAVEAEFAFEYPPHLFQGFIDLIFEWRGALYLLDWKMNWLGEEESSYTQLALEKAMQENHYLLQAAIYKEAIEKAWPTQKLKGAFYFFLRGMKTPGSGVFSFQPGKLKDLYHS